MRLMIFYFSILNCKVEKKTNYLQIDKLFANCSKEEAALESLFTLLSLWQFLKLILHQIKTKWSNIWSDQWKGGADVVLPSSVEFLVDLKCWVFNGWSAELDSPSWCRPHQTKLCNCFICRTTFFFFLSRLHQTANIWVFLCSACRYHETLSNEDLSRFSSPQSEGLKRHCCRLFYKALEAAYLQH